MWSRERTSNTVWAMAILIAVFALLVAPMPIRFVMLALIAGVWVRKTAQTWARGRSFIVAACYAVHTYFCKIPLAYGQLRYRRAPRR